MTAMLKKIARNCSNALDSGINQIYQAFNPSGGRSLPPMLPQAPSSVSIDSSPSPMPSAPPIGRLIDMGFQQGAGGGNAEYVLSVGTNPDVMAALEFGTSGGLFNIGTANMHSLIQAFSFINFSCSIIDSFDFAKLGKLTPPSPTLGLFAPSHGGPKMRMVH